MLGTTSASVSDLGEPLVRPSSEALSQVDLRQSTRTSFRVVHRAARWCARLTTAGRWTAIGSGNRCQSIFFEVLTPPFATLVRSGAATATGVACPLHAGSPGVNLNHLPGVAPTDSAAIA
jgi:hypothetical protein